MPLFISHIYNGVRGVKSVGELTGKIQTLKEFQLFDLINFN